MADFCGGRPASCRRCGARRLVGGRSVAAAALVRCAEHLLHERALEFDGDAALPLPRLPALLAGLGIADDALDAPGRRVLCRPCLDWSERRPHAAGRLGALICSHCLAQGWLRRSAASRVLQVTPRGAVALRDWLGLRAWQQVVQPER